MGPDAATETAGGWGLFVGDGRLKHNNQYSAWAAGKHDGCFHAGSAASKAGAVVGLMLDLDAGSLSCYLDGAKVGVLVGSGLTGPLCWMGELYDHGDKLAIEAREVPE